MKQCSYRAMVPHKEQKESYKRADRSGIHREQRETESEENRRETLQYYQTTHSAVNKSSYTTSLNENSITDSVF